MDGGLSELGIAVRHELRPGDVGGIIRLHGILYAEEHGYGPDFEPYVAGTFASRSWPLGARERIWIVEKDGELRGCIAIVQASAEQAQLRWFLLHPELRGRGAGRTLAREALGFCRDRGYSSVFLWTEGSLTPATTLYKSFGFTLVEDKIHEVWGAIRTEERYELSLG